MYVDEPGQLNLASIERLEVHNLVNVVKVRVLKDKVAVPSVVKNAQVVVVTVVHTEGADHQLVLGGIALHASDRFINVQQCVSDDANLG